MGCRSRDQPRRQHCIRDSGGFMDGQLLVFIVAREPAWEWCQASKPIRSLESCSCFTTRSSRPLHNRAPTGLIFRVSLLDAPKMREAESRDPGIASRLLRAAARLEIRELKHGSERLFSPRDLSAPQATQGPAFYSPRRGGWARSSGNMRKIPSSCPGASQGRAR